MKRFIAFLLILVCLFSLCGMLTACSGSSKKTYTCGYCGRKMQGAYYDYFNGRYVCRTCSKLYRK